MTSSGVGDSGGGIPLPGHGSFGEVPRWNHPLSAGGVEATISDLARYAEACLHPPRGPLGAAITATLTPRSSWEAAGTRPWPGRYGMTVSACTAAGPQDSP